MKIFEISKKFPPHFVSKLTDCDGENSETDSSLDFAEDCTYITPNEYAELAVRCEEVGRMLGSMIKNPGSFLTHH
jgi:four helix bundle protein